MYPIFLALHVIAGILSLLSAPTALIAKKGGKLHRTAGLVFYYAMLVVSISAFVVSIVHVNGNSVFLRGIGIFSLYLVLAGKRILVRKEIMNGQQAEAIDYAITSLIAIFMLFCLYYFITEKNIVLAVFGLLSSRFLYEDITLLRNKPSFKLYWLTAHISRMCGGAIASFTAFLVVNWAHLFGDSLSLVAWLLPTFIGAPIIFYYGRNAKNLI